MNIALWKQYSNVVSRSGPECEEARRLRTENAGDTEFLKWADGLDALKRVVGGSGVDEEAPAVSTRLAHDEVAV